MNLTSPWRWDNWKANPPSLTFSTAPPISLEAKQTTASGPVVSLTSSRLCPRTSTISRRNHSRWADVYFYSQLRTWNSAENRRNIKRPEIFQTTYEKRPGTNCTNTLFENYLIPYKSTGDKFMYYRNTSSIYARLAHKYQPNMGTVKCIYFWVLRQKHVKESKLFLYIQG